jgi:hypothetical protein
VESAQGKRRGKCADRNSLFPDEQLRLMEGRQVKADFWRVSMI